MTSKNRWYLSLHNAPCHYVMHRRHTIFEKGEKCLKILLLPPLAPSVGILPATASAFGAGMLPVTASAFAARLGGVRMALKGCGGRHATLRKMRNQGTVPATVVIPARSAAPLNSRPEMPLLHATEGQDLIASVTHLFQRMRHYILEYGPITGNCDVSYTPTNFAVGFSLHNLCYCRCPWYSDQDAGFPTLVVRWQEPVSTSHSFIVPSFQLPQAMKFPSAEKVMA